MGHWDSTRPACCTWSSTFSSWFGMFSYEIFLVLKHRLFIIWTTLHSQILTGHQDNAEFALAMFPTEPFVLSGGLYLCYLRVLSCGLDASLIEDSSAQARTSRLFCGVSKITSQQLVQIPNPLDLASNRLVVVPLALEVYIMATRIQLKTSHSVHLGNFLKQPLSLMQNFPDAFRWIFVCHVVHRSSAVLVMTLVLYYGMREPAQVLPWRYLSFEPYWSFEVFTVLVWVSSVSCFVLAGWEGTWCWSSLCRLESSWQQSDPDRVSR